MTNPYQIPTFQDCKDLHDAKQEVRRSGEEAHNLQLKQGLTARAGRIAQDVRELIQIARTHTQGKVEELWAEYTREKARLLQAQRDQLKALKQGAPTTPKAVPYFRKDYIEYLQTHLDALDVLEQEGEEEWHISLQTPEDQTKWEEVKSKIYRARRTIKGA